MKKNVKLNQEYLRIAIQKGGRLSEKSQAIIEACGIDFAHGSRVLKAKATNFPLEFVFLRDDDIPGYVADGIADIGIAGKNVIDEEGAKVEEVLDLKFSKCRLSIAVPRSMQYQGVKDLEGKRIATSYPRILGEYLEEHGVSADIHTITGSVEIAPTIGLADAICDIVSTGSTLLSNGLKEAESFYFSSARMIATPGLAPAKQQILTKLLMRIEAVQRAKHFKYIIFNLPSKHVDKVSEIFPGLESPTVTKLVEEGWSSVQTVVEESKFWDTLEELKALGAQGVLVTPIEKFVE